MGSNAVIDNAQHLLLQHDQYPSNLKTVRKVELAVLERYKQKLDRLAPTSCLSTSTDIDLSIRDLYGLGAFKKRNIKSEKELRNWLKPEIGETNNTDANQHSTDLPKCRFIYIWAQDSRDRLRVTRPMLTWLLSLYQVMPSYLDFMLCFGLHGNHRDLQFSGFREELWLSGTRMSAQPGQSGWGFEICFNLKGVSSVGEDVESPSLSKWSIRQAAIYLQFGVEQARSLWIITKGRLDLQQRFKQLTSNRSKHASFNSPSECFRSSLEVHRMLCQWCLEDWQAYIRWLEHVVDQESSMAIYGPRELGDIYPKYSPRNVQNLQYWGEKTSEVISILESNLIIIGALSSFYVRISSHKDFPRSLTEDEPAVVAQFTADLNEVVQHLQGQTAERTEQLSANMEREAIAMRIITIITLLYLPATFVSVSTSFLASYTKVADQGSKTFFSTDVVSFQTANGPLGEKKFSLDALVVWLQVTLPLTAMTLLGSWVMYLRAKNRETKFKVRNGVAGRKGLRQYRHAVATILRKMIQSGNSHEFSTDKCPV
ncbi:MAG: hypothetical protein M1820_007596 [Bogoriella megaspora]|nr:MAG: hypothetical protein M1820_007596 [Bogoriella megaspora]